MSLQETAGEGIASGVARAPINPHQELDGGHIGIELVYKTEPRARAWYSGNTGFTEGADSTPTHPDDDLDTSLAKLESDLAREPQDSERIATQGVRAAILYMRLEREEEKAVPAEKRTVDPLSIDMEQAADGLCWIKENVDGDFGGSLRQAAIGYRRAINGKKKASKPHWSGYATAGGQQSAGQQRESYSAKRAEKREQQRLEKIESQHKHEAERQAEISLLAEWHQEHPPAGTNHLFGILDDFDTAEKPSGGVLARPKEGLMAKTLSYVRYVAENPEILEVEIEDASSFAKFLEENDTPIISEIRKHATEASGEAWKNDLYFANPEEFKSALPRWLGVVSSLSEDYKSNIEFLVNPTRIRLNHPAETDERATQATIHDKFNLLLQNSLVKTAETHPEEFIGLVHGLLQTAFDMDDELVSRSILSELSVAHERSGAVNMLMTCTPVARVDKQEKLKCADITYALEESGYQITGVKKKAQLPKKIVRQYIRDVPEARARFGIKRNDEHGGQKLRKILTSQLLEDIKAGELPNSLYHKIQQQKSAQAA